MTRDHYEVLGAPRTATAVEVKAAYRREIKRLSPDLGHADGEAVRLLNEAHDVLKDPEARAHYDRLGCVSETLVKSKAHAYRVGALLARGDLADLRAGEDETGRAVVLKSYREPATSDLAKAEVEALRELQGHATGKFTGYGRYLPEVIDAFAVRGSDRKTRQVLALEQLSGWWSLEAIAAKRHGLPFEHAVWIMNRGLEALGFVHRHGRVHGAVLPSHLMVFASTDQDSEWDHGLKLVDWAYSVAIGECVAAAVPGCRAFYAPEVFAKKPATPATDIYMLSESVRYLLNVAGADTPDYFENFLHGCTLANPAARPQDAWELRAELRDFMRSNYGPPKYVRFTMPGQPNTKARP